MLEIKCYECQKVMETQPPYFCSEKCKLAYWHESPDQPQTRVPKTIPQIQAKLREMALTAPVVEEVEAADFFMSISNNSNVGVGSTPLPAKVNTSRQRSYPDSYL